MSTRILAPLAVLLALAASAPAAGAATATFSGSCEFSGVSTFDPPLTGTPQIVKYAFTSGAPAEGVEDYTACSGTLNGEPVSSVPVVTTVAGEGDLACSDGYTTTPGQGKIEFPDGSTFPFKFEFSSVLSEVEFVSTFANGAQVSGWASFLTYAPPTTAFDCSPAGGGIGALGFDAASDPYEGTIEGTRPDPSADGDDAAEAKKKRIKKRRRACMKKAAKVQNEKRRKAAKKRCRQIGKKKQSGRSA